MAELATLGLEVRSDGVVKASNDLATLIGSAQKAERATESLGKASEQANQRVGGGSRVYERAAAQMAKMIAIMERMEKEQQAIAVAPAASAAAIEKLTVAGGQVQKTFGAVAPSAAAFSKATKAVNDNAKLTSTQLLNLSRQGNDVITMLSLGASPMQVFASQAGQIYDALASGEGGLKGGLTSAKNSLKDFLSGISRSTLIFGGAASAAIAAGVAILSFTDKTQANFQKLEDAAKSYKDTIADIARGHKELAQAADDVFNRNTVLSGEGVAARRAAELETQRRAIEAARKQAPTTALSALPSYDPGLILKDLGRRVRGETSAKDLIDLAQEFEAGQRSAESLRTELDKLGGDATLPKYLRDVLDGLRTLADGSRDAEARIKSLNEATLQLKSDRFAKFGDQLREFIPDTKTARDRINDLAEAQANQAQSMGQALQVEDDRKKALAELDRVETNRRAGLALDVQSITAHTAAEKADIAARRARLELENDPKFDKSLIPGREEEARNQSLAMSRAQLAESSRQQEIAGKAAVDQAQFELTVIGKSAGETARLRAEFEALATAKAAARDAGFDESTAQLTEQMREQAKAIGEATDALERQNFERDIAFRIAQTGRTPQEQRIASELQAAGVEFDSAEGQYRAGLIRSAEASEKFRDSLDDVKDAGRDAFESLAEGIARGEKGFGSLINVIAQYGNKLASLGANKLFDWISGEGPNPFASKRSGSIGSTAIAQTVAKAVSSMPSYNFTSSSQIERRPLPPISAGDLASASGQIMAYSSRFKSGVDERLLTILKTAASRFDLPVTAISGYRAGDSRFHGRGLATDVQITGADGKALGNYQDAGTFRTYERFAQLSKQIQTELFPELDGMLRWGGYFSGAKGKYGALDTMHFDLGGGKVGMGGGSWSGGLTDAQRKLYPGVQSVGMNGSDLRKAVASGNLDSTRAIVSGAVPGLSARKDQYGTIGTGSAAFVGRAASPNIGMSKLGTGMQMFGAGLGALAQGYSSGSVGGGALSGFMAGLSTGNPIMAVGGAVLGAIGGIFGKSKQKKAQKKAERDQARQQFDQAAPQLAELRDEVYDIQRGSLSQQIIDINQKTQQFRDLAVKTKSDDRIGKVADVRKQAAIYKDQLKQEFRDVFAAVVSDLGNGFGLDTEFEKARAGVQQTADQYRGFIADVELAYKVPVEQKDAILATYAAAEKAAKALTADTYKSGYDANMGQPTTTVIKSTKTAADVTAATKTAADARDKALADYEATYADVIAKRGMALALATKAAREGLLKIVSGDVPEQTDIEKALAQSRGAAAGLSVELVKLGMTAEEAGQAINDALATRLSKLKEGFEKDLQGKIIDLKGVGYVNQVLSLRDERDSLMGDAIRLGADQTKVAEYFKLSAQDIIDGSELTGTAFTDLVKLFPELSGVVSEFGKVVSSTVVNDGLKAFLNDRLTEATQKRADAENDLLSAYRDQADHLEGFSTQVRDFLKNIRLGDQSPLSQRDQFFEAQRIFRDTQAKAMGGDSQAQDDLVGVSQDYLDAARDYYATSEDYFASFSEVEEVLKAADAKAVSQLDLLKKQVGSLIDIDDGVKSVADAIKALTDAIAAEKKLQTEVDGGRSFGINTERNRLIDAGVKQLGLSYTGNYGLTNGVDQFLNWRAALPADQRAAVERVINQYIGINRQLGGLIPGYAAGGVVGNGVWNKDSVLARYAGGGSIGLARGEMVVRAPSVTPRTYPVLDAINRTGIVPTNDNGTSMAALLREVQGLRNEVRGLHQTTGAGLQRNADAQERTAASSEDMARTARRAA